MPASEHLKQIAHALAAPAALAERRFLDIGKSLEQAVGILTRLVTGCQALLAELQSPELAQARQDLAAAATHIAAFSNQQLNDIADLQRLADLAAVIDGQITRMRAVGREVDVLGMNARLAAATMGAAGDDFMVFAGEIRRSAALAQGNLDRIGGEIIAAEQHLRAAHAGATNFAAHNAEVLHAIPARLASNAASLEERGQLAAATTLRVAERSEDVVRQIAAAIVALQLGDITRQRIEHMQQAAETLRQVLTPKVDGPWSGLSESEQGALLAAGCRLLSAQLLDTAAELDQEAERIGFRLGGLAADARELGRLGEQAHDATDTSHHSFVIALETDIRQTQALFDALRAAHADADHRIAAVLEAAERLVGHMATVRSMEADIRIMGLNTTLKCGRLGVIGRALGVIAQELRGCGNRTAALAGTVLSELRQLVSLAGALADIKRAQHDAAIDTVPHAMLAALDCLGRAGHRMASTQADLEQDSETVAGLLDTAAADFSVRREIGDALRRMAAEVTQIAEQVDSPSTDIAGSTERLLALLSRAYTMARERRVHASIAPTASIVAEPDLADVLF